MGHLTVLYDVLKSVEVQTWTSPPIVTSGGFNFVFLKWHKTSLTNKANVFVIMIITFLQNDKIVAPFWAQMCVFIFKVVVNIPIQPTIYIQWSHR